MPFVGFFKGLSFGDIVYWITVLLVGAATIYIGLRLLRFNHKVLIIDKRGIAKSDAGRRLMMDGTPRLKVLKAKSQLSWPESTLALTKKRNFIILVEDNSGQLHNVKMTWDSQALTTDGDFENVEDLFLDIPEVNENLETDKYGYVSLKELPLKNAHGKEIVLRKSLLLQPADTNVMREFIQNNKDTIMTYYKPSKWEKMAPYMYMAMVFTFGVVYWFALSKWH